MKRCALVVFLIAFPVSLFAAETQRYIVVTRRPFHEAARSLKNDDFDPAAHREAVELHIINAFAADLTDQEVRALKRSSEVEWVEPDLERHIMSDSVINGQQVVPYGITMVSAPGVWPVTRGKVLGAPANASLNTSAINVAVIDTGIRYNDAELRGVYRGGHNFINGTDDPMDDNGHGTHVAGTIAAANDGAGVVGLASDVNLYALKVLSQCGSGSTFNIDQAVQWVVDKKNSVGGNWVINLSLGGSDSSPSEEAVFQAAADAGVLVFAASGNGFSATSPDIISFPAAYPSVVSVGAIDSTQAVADFSQRGPDLGVVAPGVAVLSTFIGGHVATNDRTVLGTLPEAATASGKTVCLNKPNVTAQFVYCNFGATPSDFPSAVNGKIALIQRGPIGANAVTFVQKVKNAKSAGAVGAIIFDHTDEMVFPPSFTISLASDVIPTLFISKADGAALQSTPNATLTMASSIDDNLFAAIDGTSMATPHAVGVAALVWAVAPSAPARAVRDAIFNTAKDLGDPGVDNTFGHGLVDALDAAKALNPAAFGAPVTPAPTPSPTHDGRPPGRRH